MSNYPEAPAWVREKLCRGLAIPAHPLALTSRRRLDERSQRALTRYYHAAGAGGVAVGVHTTQFAIRHPKHGLFEPVLRLAAETADECERASRRRWVRIAGLCGRTRQAVQEAEILRTSGYHAGLLSLAAFPSASEREILTHCHQVAREIPILGFYLQPAVGGRVLSSAFWREFAEIPNLLAVKIAPFNRYQTLDVVRAVIASGRDDVALYTGNDDSIVVDLLTPFRFRCGRRWVQRRIVGGLLGHWAVWTQRAVELFEACRGEVNVSGDSTLDWLRLQSEVTDANAAFFDASNGFAGCIAGLHEVLRRQGLMRGVWCLDPREGLSPGQRQEIDRVTQAYPHLSDDAFVAEHLDGWLR